MKAQQIGWIGTGIMGQSMCGHLLNAGHSIHIFTRTAAKAASLAEQGAILYDSPAEVAQKSDIVFVMVGFPSDVEEVVLGKNGLMAHASAGTVIIDMTTSEPSLAKQIFDAGRERQIRVLDAPVSGGDIGAREATLAIMVGGEQEVFNRIQPLFEIMGKNIRLMGGPGSGQHTKMCNQILIAGTMIGVVESLLYAQRTGTNLDEVIDVIGSGAAASWSINNLGRRIASNDFDPGFFIKHFVKDMGIALKEARNMQLSLPGLALVHQFYVAAQAMGLEDLGTQGLYRVLQTMNGYQQESK